MISTDLAHPKNAPTVFDRGQMRAQPSDLDAFYGTSSFRRTEADRRPPRRILTALLLGDPAPGRLREPASFETGRISTESGPVLLTFREYRERYGDGAPVAEDQAQREYSGKWPFAKMKVGDTFLVPPEDFYRGSPRETVSSIQSCASSYTQRWAKDQKFSASVVKDGVRCRRVA